ncbi:MAG TPA: SEC-C metal-binding domain-containing protein [Polyangia bacterium]
MPRLTVVNPWHWLNEDGSFPDEPRLRKRSVRVAQCIEYGGTLREGQCRETLLPCSGRACTGFVVVMKKPEGDILAFCGTCPRDEFLIHDWEDTPWAQGHGEAVALTDLAKAHGIDEAELEEPDDDLLTDVLETGLARIGSPLSANEVRALVATSPHPGVVLQTVMKSIPGRGPSKKDIDHFLPILMSVWNETPRDELGGRSPTQTRKDSESAPPAPALPVNEGRNRPCPCGSGKKFKRCCIRKTN